MPAGLGFIVQAIFGRMGSKSLLHVGALSVRLSEGFLVLMAFFYLTLILLRLFQQHYCYNVTGQSQESEGSCKPARIKEVHSKLHSFQASLCTLTATHLTLIYVCTYIRLSVPLGCLIKQAGIIIIHTILNMWETPGIEPVTSDLTSVYHISSSTNWAIPPHCQVNLVPITAW